MLMQEPDNDAPRVKIANTGDRPFRMKTDDNPVRVHLPPKQLDRLLLGPGRRSSCWSLHATAEDSNRVE